MEIFYDQCMKEIINEVDDKNLRIEARALEQLYIGIKNKEKIKEAIESEC